MSKEKQIEEIAKIFCGMKNSCVGCMWDKVHCKERNYAEEIYNAGYRRQSKPFSCDHEKGSEWISVEERLPEKYGDVLCYTRNGTIFQVIYNPQYKLFNVSSDNTENALAVDYWMPLPEAPKMKGGEEQ